MLNDPILFNIHQQKNKAKAIETLVGILQGVTADKQLNELEILFLSVWIQENQFLHSDPDAIDLLDCIEDIHKSKHVTQEQVDDLRDLISQILQFRKDDIDRDHIASETNILLGIIQGIMADKRLLDTEIKNLKRWLDQSTLTDWPASAIKSRISEILSDGIISESERSELITLLSQCGHSQFTESGSTASTTITLGTTTPASIEFQNRNFCFTGTFIRGNRKTCEQLVIDRGGMAISGVSKKLHYLVLGTHPTRDWITSSYGLKIQKAIELQTAGSPVVLITEQTWNQFL